MTNQTELLAALDLAAKALDVIAPSLSPAGAGEARRTIATLTALREQIAKGPVAIAEFKGESDERFLNDVYWLEASNELIAGEHKLYALTGADR